MSINTLDHAAVVRTALGRERTREIGLARAHVAACPQCRTHVLGLDAAFARALAPQAAARPQDQAAPLLGNAAPAIPRPLGPSVASPGVTTLSDEIGGLAVRLRRDAGRLVADLVALLGGHAQAPTLRGFAPATLGGSPATPLEAASDTGAEQAPAVPTSLRIDLPGSFLALAVGPDPRDSAALWLRLDAPQPLLAGWRVALDVDDRRLATDPTDDQGEATLACTDADAADHAWRTLLTNAAARWEITPPHNVDLTPVLNRARRQAERTRRQAECAGDLLAAAAAARHQAVLALLAAGSKGSDGSDGAIAAATAPSDEGAETLTFLDEARILSARAGDPLGVARSDDAAAAILTALDRPQEAHTRSGQAHPTLGQHDDPRGDAVARHDPGTSVDANDEGDYGQV